MFKVKTGSTMVMVFEPRVPMVDNEELSTDNKYQEQKSFIPCPHRGKNYGKTLPPLEEFSFALTQDCVVQDVPQGVLCGCCHMRAAKATLEHRTFQNV